MPYTVAPFAWNHWRALWQLRLHQLAEDGIILTAEAIPAAPEDSGRDAPEWDYDHIAEVYLCGAGGFWLAFEQNEPLGHVAGQDLGGVVELRHMYVRREFRRRGIGAALVQALLDHVRGKGICAVELWTAGEGVGRKLYERVGFRAVGAPGSQFTDLAWRTNYVPGEDEVRMHMDLR